MLSFITLWLFTIGIFALGWMWLVSFTNCNMQHRDITRIIDNQDQLIMSYRMFESLGLKEKLSALKTLITQKESLIKFKIESFKNTCQSRQNKKQLVSILKQYEIYLYTKQVTLQEKQNFDWHQNLFPKELAFKNF